MSDKDRIIKWINIMLQEVSKLIPNKGVEILNTCGKECSKTSPLLEGAIQIRTEYQDNADLDTVFQAFKEKYYNTPKFTKNGNIINLIFEECTCPVVNKGVKNPYLCNCTTGYSMKIFKTLFNRPVEIKLLKSILNGDEICEQEISVKDV